MGQWTKSLPEPTVITGWSDDRAASALDDIAIAMARLTEGDKASALCWTRSAAAEVRAWRKSLPKDQQGKRRDMGHTGNARLHLRMAVRHICNADFGGSGGHTRAAEAHLRAVGKALAKEVEK